MTNPHRCVAIYQPAAPRAETTCSSKGLSARSSDARRADPPVPDGPGADATNPREAAGMLPGDGRGVGAGRERALGPTLASHRAGPRSRARSGTWRPAGTGRVAGRSAAGLGLGAPVMATAAGGRLWPGPALQISLASCPPPWVSTCAGSGSGASRALPSGQGLPPRPHRGCRHLSKPPQVLVRCWREPVSRPGSRGGR